MSVLHSLLTTKAYGLLTIIFVYLRVNIATSLILRLPNGQSSDSNGSDQHPNQSASVNASNKAVVCTNGLAWVGTGLVDGSCNAALSRMYMTEVARYQNRVVEFTGPGTTAHLPLHFSTPRKFTAGEQHTYAMSQTSGLPITEREGTCVVAVVMLSDFGRDNLPSPPATRLLLSSDLTAWSEIYSAAKDLTSGCVSHLHMAGWTAVGKFDEFDLTFSRWKDH